MLATTPTTRPSVLPGTQNLRQRRGIRAYVELGAITDPLARWGLERAARATVTQPVEARQPEASAEEEMPWPRLLLGAAAAITLWAFIGWALAPYVLLVYAWLFGVLA